MEVLAILLWYPISVFIVHATQCQGKAVNTKNSSIFFSPQRRELKKNSFLTNDLKRITYAFLPQVQAGAVSSPASMVRSKREVKF